MFICDKGNVQDSPNAHGTFLVTKSICESSLIMVILQFFFILQVLQVVGVNFMLVHCMSTLDTTGFGHA